VALGHLPVSGFVARVAFEDEPVMVDGTRKEEVSRDKSHRVVMLLKKLGEIFPPSPPPGGRKEALVLIVVDPWL
jgi:hypothetical protein